MRLGLALGYIMVCDVTLVCVHVRIVILIRELDQLAARIRYHLRFTVNRYVM